MARGGKFKLGAHKAVNHAFGTSLGWPAKTPSYVDLAFNQGVMIMKGMRLNATKYLRVVNDQKDPLVADSCTYSKNEVTQETKGAVLDTAKMLKLVVRQLVGVEFRIPPHDEPIDTTREPR